jgi:hypothetical protein
LIYDNNLLLLFLESLGSKRREMLQPSFKKQKTHATQIAVSLSISTSTFEMIKKYNASNKYDIVDDWYVQIESPMCYHSKKLLRVVG